MASSAYSLLIKTKTKTKDNNKNYAKRARRSFAMRDFLGKNNPGNGIGLYCATNTTGESIIHIHKQGSDHITQAQICYIFSTPVNIFVHPISASINHLLIRGYFTDFSTPILVSSTPSSRFVYPKRCKSISSQVNLQWATPIKSI